jgi:hypothetical protein
MSTSEDKRDLGHPAVLLLLLVSNLLLFASWPWLRGLPPGADSSDPPMNSYRKPHRELESASIYRNVGYLSWMFNAVREKQGILYLGTSESGPSYNLGAQMNGLGSEGPSIVVLPKKGLSPIHGSLLFAKCKRENLQTPPLFMVINLVYFTRSHDVVNDGWMSSITRSPVFVHLNHRNLRRELSAEVRTIFDRHFRLRNILYPIYMQEHLGNLLYLHFHRAPRDVTTRRTVPVETYRFDGTIPDYDVEQGVHVGVSTIDRIAKGRWTVKRPHESINLKGLRNTVRVLRDQPAPILLAVLPVNRTFYAYHGLDMEEFDRRNRELRDAIMSFRTPGHVHVIDLYDDPDLHLGFVDRMHPDEYGFHQLAEHLASAPEYESFIEDVHGYYAIDALDPAP